MNSVINGTGWGTNGLRRILRGEGYLGNLANYTTKTGATYKRREYMLNEADGSTINGFAPIGWDDRIEKFKEAESVFSKYRFKA